MVLRAGLDKAARGKNSLLLSGSEPRWFSLSDTLLIELPQVPTKMNTVTKYDTLLRTDNIVSKQSFFGRDT